MGSRSPARPQPRKAPGEPPPTVSVRWLLTALALALAAAALCGYAALGLLFWQGQWQLLFHPSRTVVATPAGAGVRYQDIRFDVTDTGQPQLDGWLIPADPGSKYVTDTVLYLHGGRGSLSNTVSALGVLHSLGINVFAFDYRGFGRSSGAHPTEGRASEDSIAAFTWLTDIRHIPPRRIIVDGQGVGVVFAARVAARFAPAGAVMEDPSPSARQIFAGDARARILPLWLLQNERLDPAADLAGDHAPLLFIDLGGDAARTRALFDAASAPKQIFDLRAAAGSAYRATLRRFFDDVLR